MPFLHLPDRGLLVPINGMVHTVGRHPRNDLILTDATVSRFHITLYARADDWMVVNHASVNPLLLDGEVVLKEHRIHDGSDLTLGGCHIYFRAEAPGSAPERTVAIGTMRRSRARPPATRPDVAGRGGDVMGVLSLLTNAHRTGHLELFAADGGADCQIWIDAGRLVAARCGEVADEEVFTALAGREFTNFRFHEGRFDADAPAGTITRPTAAILLDLAKTIDHGKAGTEIPPVQPEA
jgi:hypothetical protein